MCHWRVLLSAPVLLAWFVAYTLLATLTFILRAGSCFAIGWHAIGGARTAGSFRMLLRCGFPCSTALALPCVLDAVGGQKTRRPRWQDHHAARRSST